MSKIKGKARANANRKKKNKQKNDFFLRRKSLIKEIRKYDDPALVYKCEVVSESDSDIKNIFKKMKQVLNVTDNGVGLAASQIGVLKTMVIIKPDSNSASITCMINPEIVSHSEEMKFGREGCLSYPETFAFIERFTSIKISYFDEEWKNHVVEYKEGDILGIVVQHELEHLSFGHCQVYGWWKDPEGKKKELEERMKKKEETQESSSSYAIEESEDRKREKEEEEKKEKKND